MERICLWREVLYRPKPYLQVSTLLDYRPWNLAGFEIKELAEEEIPAEVRRVPGSLCHL
jgi:hypothetical protein